MDNTYCVSPFVNSSGTATFSIPVLATTASNTFPYTSSSYTIHGPPTYATATNMPPYGAVSLPVCNFCSHSVCFCFGKIDGVGTKYFALQRIICEGRDNHVVGVSNRGKFILFNHSKKDRCAQKLLGENPMQFKVQTSCFDIFKHFRNKISAIKASGPANFLYFNSYFNDYFTFLYYKLSNKPPYWDKLSHHIDYEHS